MREKQGLNYDYIEHKINESRSVNYMKVTEKI